MSAEHADTTPTAVWLLPLLVVGAVLAWLLLTAPADTEPPAELSAEEQADPTFNYGLR
jgi:hypothetical protein